MKRLLATALVVAAAASAAFNAAGWGKHGHQIVIAVAQRHLTDEAKQNIARYFDYNLQKDAVWMDQHRRDEPIAYTTAWHVYNVDKNYRYDPNPRLYKGDCIMAVRNTVWTLRGYKELSDSAVVMNIRMLIHFVGDMHCPTHAYLVGPRNHWECTLPAKNFKGTFHGVYDKIPSWLYPEMKPDEVAALLDDCSASQIKKIQKGTVEDWAADTGEKIAPIYDINPFLTKELAPDTVERSKDMVDVQLRNAGYRLARLLNELFAGK